ncbi:MAG TPA: DUF402 domain-containing protein [Longimicrobiales bacterium]
MDGFVHIHYHRPPDRHDIFVQRLVHRTAGVIVTFLERTPLPRPIEIGGRIALEDGAPAIWFTFPGAWHDIGRFHRADGTFTGIYANILTPVRFEGPDTWSTTDLYLDVWLEPDGRAALLDEDEFARAAGHGWIDAEIAGAARAEAERILARARRNAWPPAVVREWTLERVHRHLAGAEAAPHERRPRPHAGPGPAAH